LHFKRYNLQKYFSRSNKNMASRKQIEAREAARKRDQTQRMIQVGGGIVLVLIVIGILWLVLSGGSPDETAVPTDVSSAPDTSAGANQYNAYPEMTIDANKQYFATVTMANGGQFTIQLFPDKAPLTVNSFVFLARQGYFDGTTFHRVLEGFMAQGGDPTGTGMGGPGYQFENEDSDLTFDKAGVVAMANAGRDTNGSQFFITFAPADFLNGGYTIFGQVVEGMDVVNSITRRDPDQNPSFTGDAIQTVEITEQ
jgi:cyclophilin family peptidyl-prolyl cis-trans isomerase